MLSKTLIVALCLNSLVVAAPLPNGGSTGPSSSSSTTDWSKTIQDIAGSPFGNGVGNGNGNSAGNDNQGNGNSNFGGNGNQNGDGNTFGNKNGFFSGNSGLSLGRRNDGGSSSSSPSSSSPSWSSTVSKTSSSISDVAGSPFGNGDGNGNGNTAGSGNSNNGNGNFGQNGNGNGDWNEFGNGNGFFSGNQGIGLGKKVRREAASIPPGTFYLVPPQLADSLNQDFSQLFTVVVPETGPAVIQGALTGNYPTTTTSTKREEKRQILTGLEDIIAESASQEAPPDRSGFFGIPTN